MNLDDRMSGLGVGAEHGLRQEFPTWWIRRGESGWWIAIRKGCGIMRAPSADELRDLLHRFGGAGTDGEDGEKADAAFIAHEWNVIT